MSLPNSITYNDTIKENIVASGGTIVFIKDNIIVASEISEKQFRELLDNPYIEKIDVLPLKRYKNEGITYTPTEVVTDIIDIEDIDSENSSLSNLNEGSGGRSTTGVGGVGGTDLNEVGNLLSIANDAIGNLNL